jgi:hypothetical protein
MTQTPKAYSYTRFSIPEQLKGDSLRCQLEATRNYAKANGFNLDESLTIRNEGLSDSSGTHQTEGSLGYFLKAVKNGKIPAGSLLIIENLDMLSREETITAMSLFSGIIDNGVSIVTLNDGLEYNRDTINTNVVHISRQIIGMLY